MWAVRACSWTGRGRCMSPTRTREKSFGPTRTARPCPPSASRWGRRSPIRWISSRSRWRRGWKIPFTLCARDRSRELWRPIIRAIPWDFTAATGWRPAKSICSGGGCSPRNSGKTPKTSCPSSTPPWTSTARASYTRLRRNRKTPSMKSRSWIPRG